MIEQWNFFFVLRHFTNVKLVFAVQPGNLRTHSRPRFRHIQNFHFLSNGNNTSLLLGLEAPPASLLLRFVAIITVNRGFLNTNTAITWQLIRTARTLEAEWWQVWGEVWVRRQREMSQVVGAFPLLYFTMVGPVLALRAFWNLWTVYFFNFPIFFRAAVNCGYGSPSVHSISFRRYISKFIKGTQPDGTG